MRPELDSTLPTAQDGNAGTEIGNPGRPGIRQPRRGRGRLLMVATIWKWIWGMMFSLAVLCSMASAESVIRAESGILVLQVLAGSQAEKAGLLEDDLIIGYNRVRVRKVQDLMTAVANTGRDQVPIVLYREGEKRTIWAGKGKLGIYIDTGVVICPPGGCTLD
ncbi:MAG: PDZ domain-containing protein [Deltaproteobacteria bacterium]|nr:PDZ domain-containing protein [Deltaproteobacteria bacterium]